MSSYSECVSTTRDLRIACLEPSATAICLELGLWNYFVGVTHECGPVLDAYYEKNLDKLKDDSVKPRVLTRNGLTVESQFEIHQAIQETAAAAKELVCKIRNDNKDELLEEIPSLYPLLHEEMDAARPTVVFTQDLCSVCAPTTTDVRRCLLRSNEKKTDKSQDSTMVSVIALHPTTLHEVADTFVTIAETCQVPQRGQELKAKFLNDLQTLQRAIQSSRDCTLPVPRLFILEWLDPPFDSGHWTYQMMEYACVRNARTKTTHKALAIEWEDVYKTDPDLIVVGCCGFDLERNVQDTLCKAGRFREFRAGINRRIFACNGDRYIAQPAPSLLQGVALLAQCAYQQEPKVLDAISSLGYESIGWEEVNVMNFPATTASTATTTTTKAGDLLINDIEDLVDGRQGFAKIHREACEQGRLTYTDPETGYSVFTEIAHKQRGKCCGSGCRHCPYSHENVIDKASKIQQPTILYRQKKIEPFTLFSVHCNKRIKVLFFSGGKDSFLAIRALVRSYFENEPFGLVLLTTFDATTRIIAHQEVSIDEVIRQATHLDIALLGIPLRRGSGETYMDRIREGLIAIKAEIPNESRICSLVFGDLHLSHVKEWRDSILTKLDYDLEYPLWKVPYSKLLVDLERSQVPCRISGSSRKEVKVGEYFDRKLFESLINSEIDAFGEAGEFYSLALVCETPRTVALGLSMVKE